MHRAHRSAQAEVERGEDRQDWPELSNAFEYDTSCGRPKYHQIHDDPEHGDWLPEKDRAKWQCGYKPNPAPRINEWPDPDSQPSLFDVARFQDENDNRHTLG